MIQEPEPKQITIYQHLFQIYPDIPQYSEEHKRIQKYETINKRFAHIYGKEPKCFVKCPGSLVLFGDSADYSQLPFIGCSIPNDVVIVFAKNENKEIRVNHFQKSRYPEEKISITDPELKEGEQWKNIIVIALKINSGLKIEVSTGVDVLVYTDLLDRNDLGKASSYLYAFVLGIAMMSGKSDLPTKQAIFKQLKRYEDKFEDLNIREISLYAQNNKLLDPSTKQLFDFVKGYTMVLAHSCTPFSPKSVQIKQGKKLNLRRCQIRLGIEIIKSELGIEKELNNLKQLKTNLGYNTEQFLDCVQQYIPNKLMTAEQIENETSKSLIQILKSIPFSNNVIQNYKSFHPYNAVVYLLKQQLLIEQLKILLRSQPDQSKRIQCIKEIINKSRQLQNQHLQPKSQQVSKLLEIAGEVKEGKCYKLVGDTTRGNIIFFVEKQKAQFLIDHLLERYYESQQIKMMLADSSDQYVYEVIPTMGVAVLDPQYEIWL